MGCSPVCFEARPRKEKPSIEESNKVDDNAQDEKKKRKFKQKIKY